MATTTDYEKFKSLEYNRNLTRKHIDEMKDAITKHGYLEGCPILVTEDFEIIDGQHRFTACKEMGLPINYSVVSNGSELMALLNTTQKKWSLDDYANFWAKKEQNSNYLRLINVSKDTGLGLTAIVSISRGSIIGGEVSETIKRGTSKFTTEDGLKVRAFDFKLKQLCKLLRLKPTTRFCSALVDLNNRRNFKWDILLSKAEKYRTVAYNCRTKEEFIIMLKDLYNFNTRREGKRI